MISLIHMINCEEVRLIYVYERIPIKKHPVNLNLVCKTIIKKEKTCVRKY